MVVPQKQVTAGFNIVELNAGLDCVSSGVQWQTEREDNEISR